MRRFRVRVAAAVVVALTSLVGTPIAADADVAPPAQVKSNFENHYGAKLVRDCGYSQPVPGATSQSFWLFCDTAVYDWAGNPGGFIAGSTAARGPATPGLVPTGISELPTPPAAVPSLPNNAGPAQFLPTPSGLVRSDGTACAPRTAGEAVYPASWVSGLTTIPGTSRYLITYTDVCIQPGWVFTVSRFGMVEYAPSTNTLSNDRKLFTVTGGANLPNQLQLGSPIFSGGNLYLFSSVCSATGDYGECTSGSVWEARVSASSRGTPSAYRYRRGSSWETSYTSATSVISGARPTEVSVQDYTALGRGIVIAEATSIGGTYRLWQAGTPSGSFTGSGTERTTAGCTVPAGVVDFCHALIGHPDLSTSSQLALTYYAVEDQHVRMVAVPWP